MSETELLELFRKVTCNGSREMTEERFIHAVKEIEITMLNRIAEFETLNEQL